jgi:hypothetical protein
MASTFPTSIDSFTDPLSTSPLNSPSHSLQHANLNDAVNKIETYMGLVYVGQVTAGSGVTTLTLNNVFSATYNAYRIVVSGGSVSAALSLSMQLIDSGGSPSITQYYETFIYSAFSGSTVLAANTNNGSNFVRTANAISSSDCATGASDLVNPFLSKFTHYYNSANPGGGNGGNSIGYHGVTSSYTGIKLTSSVASALTGTILTVYGYRLG